LRELAPGNPEMAMVDEHGVEDDFARTCEACGTALTPQEIEEARESGGPFLCSVHADEELPADELARDEEIA
jgi:2-keto-3-deoxy-6-phosphogluconate aldolase